MSSTLHITHLKLGWLRRRRDELRARYAAIAARASAANTPAERLAALRAGLAELRAGSEQLHPEAAVLEHVLPLGATGLALAPWIERLDQEVVWGRARAEYGWIFAGLIEEWVASEPEAIAASMQRHAGTTVVTAVAAPFDVAALDVIANTGPAWTAMRAQLAKELAELVVPVENHEVKAALEDLANGPYQAHPLRRAARDVARDDTMCGEYTGAVALMLDAMAEWRWPATGVPARVVEAVDKRRLYLEPELLEALFVSVIAKRWIPVLWEAMTAYGGVPRREPHTVDEALHAAVAKVATLRPFHTLMGDHSGSSHYVSADAVFDGADAREDWLDCLDARIRGQRIAYPDRPVLVIVADVAAFGPSMPHEVLDRLAALVGVPQAWRDLLARYLAVPVRTATGVETTRRGFFPDQLFPLAFAEALLALIEAHVAETTGVHAVRLVDDFALVSSDPAKLANAWATLSSVMAAAGLTLHHVHGASLFGAGVLPAGVPAEPIRAGHLVLQPDGAWTVDLDGVEAARVATWRRVVACTSVFEAAHVFSDGVRHALRRLSPFAPFGPAHVQRVAAAIAPFYRDIVAHLVERLRARMPDVDASAIPAGVWYWPRTAGGAGLFDATSQLAGILAWWSAHSPEPVGLPATRDELLGPSEPLARYLRTPTIRPRQPPFTSEVAARVVDFVRRGAELRGDERDDDKSPHQLRHGLSFYWQWVVALHGPTLLSAFGTFRFVEASRMPFGAIVELGWLGPH